MPAPADPLVLSIGGRVALTRAVGARLEAEKDLDALRGIRGALAGAHLRIANLEGPLGGVTPEKGVLRARALAGAGLDVLVTGAANAQSRGPLESAGIKLATVAPDDTALPLRLSVQGWWVSLVVSAADRPDERPGALERAVERARAEGTIVLVLHDASLDDEAGDVPLSRRALAAGADGVLGLGAKMPLGVSWIGGRPAIHGLGGLVAEDDPKEPWTARGVFARLRYFRGGRREVDLCPYRLASGLPTLLAGPGRPTEEGIFSRTLLRRSEVHGGTNLSEPDLHSCLRVTPRNGVRRDGG
jgi:hypothetical protein